MCRKNASFVYIIPKEGLGLIAWTTGNTSLRNFVTFCDAQYRWNLVLEAVFGFKEAGLRLDVSSWVPGSHNQSGGWGPTNPSFGMTSCTVLYSHRVYCIFGVMPKEGSVGPRLPFLLLVWQRQRYWKTHFCGTQLMSARPWRSSTCDDFGMVPMIWNEEFNVMENPSP